MWIHFKDTHLEQTVFWFDMVVQSKEISQEIRKIILVLHKSGSYLGTVSHNNLATTLNGQYISVNFGFKTTLLSVVLYSTFFYTA